MTPFWINWLTKSRSSVQAQAPASWNYTRLFLGRASELANRKTWIIPKAVSLSKVKQKNKKNVKIFLYWGSSLTFPYHISKCMNENCSSRLQIALLVVPNGSIRNISPMYQVRLGVERAPSHYISQCWHNCIFVVLGPKQLTQCCYIRINIMIDIKWYIIYKYTCSFILKAV